MINIYEVVDKKLIISETIKQKSWIDLVNPTPEEIKQVIDGTGIDKEILVKLLDEEELPRVEKRSEETVIILDTPYLADNNYKHKYKTNPLGIIISEKGYLITVSLKEQPFLDYFKDTDIENFKGKDKSNFILQLFIMVAGIYQRELTNFITSLKANEIALEKVAKGTIITIDKTDEELLSDALIETKQAIEMATIYREILSSMTDTYATIISNNLNDVMKFLASITIVCSIPTMVASFIGMNVPLGSIGDSPLSFILIIIVSILLSLIIAYILKRKNLL